MTPQQFVQVKQLFAAAVELPEPERAAFVERGSGDDVIVRAAVERLLREQTRGGGAVTGLRQNLNRALGRQPVSADTVRSPGQVVSHYRLEHILGAGGMGEVWRAEDLALGRPSALKLLRPELGDTLRARLLREAEASARLQHPGIATFYESGETGGLTWLAMEYVTGQTLRNRLEEGPLLADEALALGATLLEALVHAHAAGVLHRDVKPENVMLTDHGATKLLDFGLAMWAAEPDAVQDVESPTATAVTRLTAHGAVAGTVGYMSPEQLRGEPLDARADVFGVGAVLHEALTGRPAFPGTGLRERMAAVLSLDPEPLAGPGIPGGLAEVLQRALAREASERYPDASTFLADLRRVAEGRAISGLPHTLAVFDLDNLSRNEEDDWIGSGLGESLAADLGRVVGLKVVAREKILGTQVRMAAEKGDTTALDVGRRLACRWILSGSFQRMGAALRVTARLIDVGTGAVVAAHKIDGKIEEIFAIQDRLSEAVAENLNLTVESAETAPELDAYESYAKGKRLVERLAQGTMEEAAEYLQRAVELDPEYVPALALLAQMYAMRFIFTVDPGVLDTAADHARRALRRDPDNALAHAWLGYALWRQGGIEDGLREQQRAIELDPDGFEQRYFAACCLSNLGRHEEAVPHAQKAAEEQDSPILGWVLATLGMAHLALGHAQEARWTFERAEEVRHRPGQSPQPYAVMALWHHYFGDPDEARRIALAQEDLAAANAAFDQAAAQIRGRPRVLGSGYDLVQAQAGQACAGAGAEAFEEALQLMEQREGFNFCWVGHATDNVTLLQLSRAAATLGRDEQARELLERARAAGLTPTLEGLI